MPRAQVEGHISIDLPSLSGVLTRGKSLWRIELVYNPFMCYVYMIKNDFGKLYVGVTQNLQDRLNYHNAKQGAKFTKGKSKFRIVFSEEYTTLTDTRQREVQIKKWRRDKKEALIKLYASGLITKMSK